MPAAPSRTSSKRKVESDQDESDHVEESSQNTKKPRKGKAPLPVPTQPTNKVMPVNIVIPPKNEGAVRIVAWNICGFAASSKKVSSLPYRGIGSSLTCSLGFQSLCGS